MLSALNFFNTFQSYNYNNQNFCHFSRLKQESLLIRDVRAHRKNLINQEKLELREGNNSIDDF